MGSLKGRIHVPGENALLSALPPDERQGLRLERVSLGLKEVIYELDGPIPHVDFPLNSVYSLVIVMADGRAVEVGTVGNEGMVGLPLLLGSDRSPYRTFTQVPGDALR